MLDAAWKEKKKTSSRSLLLVQTSSLTGSEVLSFKQQLFQVHLCQRVVYTKNTLVPTQRSGLVACVCVCVFKCDYIMVFVPVARSHSLSLSLSACRCPLRVESENSSHSGTAVGKLFFLSAPQLLSGFLFPGTLER